MNLGFHTFCSLKGQRLATIRQRKRGEAIPAARDKAGGALTSTCWLVMNGLAPLALFVLEGGLLVISPYISLRSTSSSRTVRACCTVGGNPTRRVRRKGRLVSKGGGIG